MPSLAAGAVSALLSAKDYPALERELARAPAAEVASLWPELGALDKLVVFKLLDAARALEVFEKLPFSERYFVFSGFPLQSIAPVLEELTPAQRRPFVQLPRDHYERMFRLLGAR